MTWFRRLTTVRTGVADLGSAKRMLMTGLTTTLNSHTFVGTIDLVTGQSLIQHGTKLYLVNHNLLCDALFYQLALRQFNAMGRLQLEPPPSVRELLQIAMEGQQDWEDSGMEPAAIIDVSECFRPRPAELSVSQTIFDLLMERAEMLDEYFSLRVDAINGTLESVPMVLPGWTPSLDKLPLREPLPLCMERCVANDENIVLLRLGAEVDWTEEKACFSGICKELAFFNTPELPPGGKIRDDQGEEDQKRTDKQLSQLRHVAFPSFRYLQAPTTFIESKTVVHIASLENLYKVFERC